MPVTVQPRICTCCKIRKHSDWDALNHHEVVLHGLMRCSSARLNC